MKLIARMKELALGKNPTSRYDVAMSVSMLVLIITLITLVVLFATGVIRP